MTEPSAPATAANLLEIIARHLAGLRFGQVVISVHEGRVVQIERTDRIRPTLPPPVG